MWRDRNRRRIAWNEDVAVSGDWAQAVEHWRADGATSNASRFGRAPGPSLIVSHIGQVTDAQALASLALATPSSSCSGAACALLSAAQTARSAALTETVDLVLGREDVDGTAGDLIHISRKERGQVSVRYENGSWQRRTAQGAISRAAGRRAAPKNGSS